MRHSYMKTEIISALAGALFAGLDKITIWQLAIVLSVRWVDVLEAAGELVDARPAIDIAAQKAYTGSVETA